MQEKMQITIPQSNKWHTKDIEAKAAKLGMDKSEFIMEAIDMMMNFDETFYKKVQMYAKAEHIPEWLVMQNLIIERMAHRSARVQEGTFTSEDTILVPVLTVPDGKDGFRQMTAGEYFNALKQNFVMQERRKKQKPKTPEEIKAENEKIEEIKKQYNIEVKTDFTPDEEKELQKLFEKQDHETKNERR